MQTNLSQRLDGIQAMLNAFRLEQERSILKSVDDPKFRASKVQPLMPPRTLSGSNAEEMKLNAILNVESVFMPAGEDVQSAQKLWPQALVAGRYGESVRMGNIESHGSLWKLIQRKDNSPGVRALIQAAEIGEEPLYLNSNLQLVPNKIDAAVWIVKLCTLHEMKLGSEFTASDSKTTRGLIVSLELLETNTAAISGRRQVSFANHGNDETIEQPAEHDSLVFCCGYSYLQSTMEVSLVSHSTLKRVYEERYDAPVAPKSAAFLPDGELRYATYWEICPESWINDELDFLDRYLS
jgi:hypothetical protein